MGVSIPVGFGLASIEVSASFGTAPFYTTFGVDLTEAGGEFVAASNSAFAAYTSAFQGRTGDQFTMLGCNLLVAADGGSGSVRSTLPPVTGSRSSSSDAVAMAACVYKLTNVLGRAGRGKQLLPGVLAETDVGAAGTIDTTPKSAILNAYIDFLELLVTPAGELISLPMVLLHSETVGLNPTPVIGTAVRDKVAWVRGRLF